jgi:3-oxoacyl-[acyl-carrier protein] reductase
MDDTTKKPLVGQVALVTGASRGIGLAIARSLGRLGATLSLCARDSAKLSEAVSKLDSEGISAAGITVDVRRPDEIVRLVDRTQREAGPIDMLVNNAGIGYFAPVQDADEKQWDAVLDTNLKAVFLLSKAVAPGMIARGKGHIINIASLAGKNAFATGSIYCASKWGLLGLTKCMAEDLRGHGIRVSAVCPGSVETDFSPHAKKDASKMLQPEDVALTVETIVLQAPQSFISEVELRPAQKP